MAVAYEPITADEQERISGLNRRFLGIWSERQSYEERWRDLATVIDPTRARFMAPADHNKGNRSRNRILDPVATRALRIAQAGLLAGMASPSRPWFTLGTPDGSLERLPPVAEWLESFRDGLLSVYDRSNFYQALGRLFSDELLFGTAAMAIFEDPERIIRCQVFPIGSYAVGQNNKGRVVAFIREYTMTAEQAVEEFGREGLSSATQNALERKNFQAKVVMRHAIWPRKMDGGGRRFGREGMPWEELFWEYTSAASSRSQDTPNWGAAASEGSGSSGRVLREGGYREFPVIVARWEKNDDDVYGTSCPAQDALGDIKELQAQRRAYSNALAKIVNPPLAADPSVEGRVVSLMAGATTFAGQSGGRPAVQPIHEVKLQIAEVLDGMQRLQESIRDAFMIPIWQMLLNDSRSQPPTAEEIRARLQEKADILGPILERHSDDVFDPTIERTAAVLIRRSLPLWALDEPAYIPPPPDELQGAEVRPVYISEVAQAQKLQSLLPIERHINFIGAYAGIDPTAIDILDTDEVVRKHADILGVPETLTRDEDEVAALRADRARQQQAVASAQMAPGLAKAAKDLSETKPNDGSLAELLGSGQRPSRV